MNKAILKKTKGKYMAHIPQTEITGAMTALSSGAYRLLMYYYSRNDGWVFDDTNIATTIGTSPRQVKKFRKELLDKEYLLIQKGQTDVYFIGQGAVQQFTGNTYKQCDEDIIKEPLILKDPDA